ncbi:MAG: sulfatase-like hydrolase/transferase [Terriglobales bacterium]
MAPPLATAGRILRWRGWRRILAYVVLPNLPFAVASRFLFSQRAFMNLDYLALGIVSPLLNSSAILFSFAIISVLDIVQFFAPAYHFSMADILASVTEIRNVSSGYAVPVALGMLAVPVVSAVCLRRLNRPAEPPSRGGRLARDLIVTALVIVALDFANGTSLVSFTQRSLVSGNISNSVLGNYARGFLALQHSDLNVKQTESATSQALSAAAIGSPHARQNIVVVIVESLGLFNDPEANQAILEPLLLPAVRQRYRVELGSTAFRGSTTSAEFRELCGLSGLQYRNVDPKRLAGCLPWRLRAQGFSTVAVHGYTRQMFNRDRWYPLAGFERDVFAEDMGPMPRCGSAFRGVCDASAASIVQRELTGGGAEKKFVYWLTLNSHLPVNAFDSDLVGFDCSSVRALAMSDVCAISKAQHTVMSSVADLAMNPALAPTLFIIVGDHAPPFIRSSERNLFSSDRVPFVVLYPLVNGASRHLDQAGNSPRPPHSAPGKPVLVNAPHSPR